MDQAIETNAKPTADIDVLEIRWLELFSYYCSNIPRGDMNKAEILALRRFASKAGKSVTALAIMEAAMKNWTDLATVIKRDSREENRVPVPTIVALANHFALVKRWATERGHLPDVPMVPRKGHVRIGIPQPAEPYVSHTQRGIA